jgi:uncharacterized membrane protein
VQRRRRRRPRGASESATRSALLASRAGRTVAALLAALAVGTVVGIAVLWPGGEADVELGPALSAGSERAEIERIESFACSGFQTDTCRRVEARLLSGPDTGGVAAFELGVGGPNPDLEVGNEVRVVPQVPPGGGQTGDGSTAAYTFTDFERRGPMLWLALAFAALVILFGRGRGALSLVGLALSLVLVAVFIVPAILEGAEPLPVAVVGSFAVMFATIPLAHGLGPKSLAAMLGSGASLLLTIGLALACVKITHLTGLSSEEATLLQTNELGVSLQGLVLAGIVIAALGVLDDMTVSQASTVMALRAVNPGLDFRGLLGRALRVGQDHVSATVNTLVLAYVGAALPLLLIFSATTLGFTEVINFEIVATEIVATLVGSIGLIAAAPITAAVAAYLASELPPQRLTDGEETPAAHVH